MSKFIIIDNINSPLLAKKLRKCHYNYISNNLIIQYKKNLKIPLHELFSIDYLKKNIKQNKLEHYLICYLLCITAQYEKTKYINYFKNTTKYFHIILTHARIDLFEKIICKVLHKYDKINNTYYFHHFKIVIYPSLSPNKVPYRLIFY